MSRKLALVTLADGADSGRVAELESAAALGQHLPGTVGGGHYTWDGIDEPVPSGFDDVADVDLVELELIDGVVADPSFAGEIKRTLLLRVEPDAPANSVAAFERDLMAMPDHIPAIVNWALSRVVGPPTSPWTHCWEQEYYTLDGLKVDYMMSPHHWGLIDGWFDPEMPRQIVDLELAHVYHTTDRSVLAAALG
ncbi:MAG: Dabb family protein [Acidimicrobiia bacterium]|nr:Dabb family protein [Acidimicrobiia bacterium]MYG58165.1 Dabb family protein [Acidimicrobiia bacterium]MYJ32930.1 Dabb family protein [Acidimicrobiia bacterium]